MRFRSENSNNIDTWKPEDGNVPYRGGVKHLPGQDEPRYEAEEDPQRVTSNPEDVGDIEVQGLPSYGKPEERPAYVEPIPVNVVDFPVPYEYKAANFNYVPLTEAVPRRLVGRNRARTRLQVRCFGTGQVYINDNMVDIENGFRINSGQTPVDFVSHDEVWVIADGADLAVSILEEYNQRT